MIKVILSLLLATFISQAANADCNVSLDDIHSKNEMMIEVASMYRHTIPEVSDLNIYDFDFKILKTGALPGDESEECSHHFIWKGIVTLRGENTAHCLIKQLVVKKLETFRKKPNRVTFEIDSSKQEIICN